MLERDEKRRGPRTGVDEPAYLRVGDLVLPGSIRDIGDGGLFLSSHLSVEVGEEAFLTLARRPLLGPLRCRVIWIRGYSYSDGPGMGLAFEPEDSDAERRTKEVIAMVLAGT